MLSLVCAYRREHQTQRPRLMGGQGLSIGDCSEVLLQSSISNRKSSIDLGLIEAGGSASQLSTLTDL